MSAIDEIKQKFDVVEVIGQYTKLTKSGRTFRGLCPFHSEKRPSFFVYPEQQSWHCFGACNTGGDVFSFIMKKEGASFGDALRLLADKAGIVIASGTESEAESREREKLYQINQSAAQFYNNLLINSGAGEKARSYVHSRGLNQESITSFQLGYSLDSWDGLKQYLTGKGFSEAEVLAAGLIARSEAGKTYDRFRNQLMFPISDDRGRVAGFGARVLDDSLPKYINSPQTPLFDKSGSLYGINLAKPAIRQQDQAVLVEGYMDVIMAHQNGFSNVIAPMGTSITEKQINQIKKLTRNIALALDADAAGEEAMLRCVGYENALDTEVNVITLPAGKDPDEVIKEDTKAWQSLVEAALPVVEYTINVVASKLDLSTARDKSLVVSKLMPLITEVKNEVRRSHYLNMLVKLTGIELKKLEAVLVESRLNKKSDKAKKEASTSVLRSVRSSPVEEYLLTLLLHYPELKVQVTDLPPEYFENSENYEVFICWQRAGETAALKEMLDPVLQEHLLSLLARSLPPGQVEKKCADCVLRLRERFLRNLETKKERALALEESGGTADDIARLEEQQGIEVRKELQKVFSEKAKLPGEVVDER